MSEQPTKEPDVDLDREDIRDRHGNRVTREYVERALADILDENTPVAPSDVLPVARRCRVGVPIPHR